MSIVKEIENLVAPLLPAEGMELVDVTYVPEGGKKVVRVFLDKEGGIKLSDCEDMSRRIGDVLDASGLLPDNYVLEVSSPGLDRVLKKEADFIKFTGKAAHITLYAPIEGQRNFTGKIVSAGRGSVTITDNSTGKTAAIPLDKIARARLEPEI